MGLEILQEFRPITPIRTFPSSKSFKHNTQESEVEITKELNEEEECHTPKSASQTLKIPLVCPPAPKKPRLPPRNYNLAPPPCQGRFFQVPRDLASVFVLRKPNLPTSSKEAKLATLRSFS